MTTPPAVAVEALRTRLHACGFAEAKGGFVRARDGVGCRVTSERFRWPVPGQARFRWTLDVVLATGTGELRFPGLRGGCSIVVSRPTTWLSGDEDHYWVAVNGDESWIAAYLAHLDEDLLPFVRRIGTVDGAIAALEERGASTGFTLGIALARLGRKDEARRHFRRALGDPAAIAQRAALEGVEL